LAKGGGRGVGQKLVTKAEEKKGRGRKKV